MRFNRLAKSGAEVLHQEIAPVRVSGHGNAEEIRTILAVLRPRNVMPVHGELHMLFAQARLARDAGVPADRIVLAENGSVVELRGGIARLTDQLGVGHVRRRVGRGRREGRIRDRRHLSEDGVLIVATVGFQSGGEIAAPGGHLSRLRRDRFGLEEAKLEAERTVEECLRQDVRELKLLQEHIHDNVQADSSPSAPAVGR